MSNATLEFKVMIKGERPIVEGLCEKLTAETDSSLAERLSRVIEDALQKAGMSDQLEVVINKTYVDVTPSVDGGLSVRASWLENAEPDAVLEERHTGNMEYED